MSVEFQFQQKSLEDDYKIEQTEFGFIGKHKEGHHHGQSSLVSVHYYDKEKVNIKKLEKQLSALKMYQGVDFNSVQKLVEIREDNKHYIFLLDIGYGVDVFSQIGQKGGVFSETQASRIFHQVLEIVNLIHEKNIIISYLKPNNIIYEDRKFKRIKLCNLYESHYSIDKRNLDTISDVDEETLKYIAPEVHSGKFFTASSDMYSLGALLYLMLTGTSPPEESLFSSKEWSGISSPAKDCLSSLLHKDHSKRPTAKKLLESSWFRRGSAEPAETKAEQRNKPKSKSISSHVPLKPKEPPPTPPKHTEHSTPTPVSHRISLPPQKTKDLITSPKGESIPLSPLPLPMSSSIPSPLASPKGLGPPSPKAPMSGWTFSDILGLAVIQRNDGTEEMSKTEMEDLNTKSSASNYASPRTPKPVEVPPESVERKEKEKKKQKKIKVQNFHHKGPESDYSSLDGGVHMKSEVTNGNTEDLKNRLHKEMESNQQLRETINLLEAKIISITSINAALEDQIDQILEENRKLRHGWTENQKVTVKPNKKEKDRRKKK